MLTKKLPERDGEIMHSMDETTTDAAFERETTDPSAALPAIEKQIREQVAADIWEYWDACGYLIDDRNSARQAIDAIAAQIAKGANNA